MKSVEIEGFANAPMFARSREAGGFGRNPRYAVTKSSSALFFHTREVV